MARLLAERFVCTYAKKGTLTVYKNARSGRMLKEGGNIISYVCTPDGRVLHAIPGAPQSADYLTQLRLGVELAGLNRDRFRERHDLLARFTAGRPAVHKILAAHPLVPLSELEGRFFKEVLGQTYDPGASIRVEVLDDAAWREEAARRVMI